MDYNANIYRNIYRKYITYSIYQFPMPNLTYSAFGRENQTQYLDVFHSIFQYIHCFFFCTRVVFHIVDIACMCITCVIDNDCNILQSNSDYHI